VMFQDIPYYPQEMTRKIIENLETELLQRALTGYDRSFTDAFLMLLPSKKGMMIQNDLLHGDANLPQSQCAESRRSICEMVEREFETQRFKIFDFWKGQDEVNGVSREITKEFGTEATSRIGTSGDDDQNKAA